VAVVVLLLALVVGAVVSWHFASEVVVPNHHESSHIEVTVQGAAPGQVVLPRSEDTMRPGVYGLEWHGGGRATLEGVLSSSASTVTRRLSAVHGGQLARGVQVAIDTDVYTGNPQQALGLPFRNVSVPDELGSMPAWLIPGRSRTWAIVVHGINADREDDLYLAPPLHRAGLPTLLITYRDDLGAPRSPDGLHHMGLTEWRDLQAAVSFALSHGAQHVVLAGFSMGGAIVAQFMERSPLANHVAGLVLDAPALSWKAILSFNASEMGLPAFAALPVEWTIDLRIHPNWGSLDALDHPSSFHLPILLFHGTADKLVPISTSDAFARELRGWVTYYRVPQAGHVQSWNVDPRLYEQRLAKFLAGVGA
jgi:alpha-beta hydrolase superfamily lysophospholipase